MRVKITNTVLRAMPYAAWQKTCIFLEKDGAEYTHAQKPAAYCWGYLAAMYNSGFSGFWNVYTAADKAEFDRHFTLLKIREVINPIVETVENGQVMGEELFDAWFDEASGVLNDAVQDYVFANENEFFEIVDEDYTVAPHGWILPLAGVMAGVVLTSMVAIAATQTLVYYGLFYLMFLTFASPFLALVLYALFWRVKVDKDVLTLRSPWHPKRTLRIAEITHTKKKNDKIIIYANGKKAFTLLKENENYAMLFAQLRLAGKIEEISLDNFTVHQQKANIITAFMWPVFAGVFLYIPLRPRPIYMPTPVLEIAVFSALFIIALAYALFIPWRKIIVDSYNLTVIKMVGNEKVFPLESITRADVTPQQIAIYAGRKKVATVTRRCEGSAQLLQGLKNVQLPIEFY